MYQLGEVQLKPMKDRKRGGGGDTDKFTTMGTLLPLLSEAGPLLLEGLGKAMLKGKTATSQNCLREK